MIKRIIFYLLMILLNSCNHHEYSEVIVKRLVEEVSKKLAVRHHLLLENISSDKVGEEIKKIRVRYILNKGAISKNELRQIIIDCIEEFLESVNNKDKIKPFLKEYPFTLKSLSIGILMYNLDGSSLHYPDISVVSGSNNNIYYNTMDVDGFHYETEEKETFDEAKAILKKTRKTFKSFDIN